MFVRIGDGVSVATWRLMFVELLGDVVRAVWMVGDGERAVADVVFDTEAEAVEAYVRALEDWRGPTAEGSAS